MHWNVGRIRLTISFCTDQYVACVIYKQVQWWAMGWGKPSKSRVILLFVVLRCFVIKLQNCFFITFANSVVARNTYHSIIYSQCRKFYWCLSLLFQPPFLNPNTENVTLVFFGSFLFFLVWSFQSAFWFWLLFWFLYFLVLRRRANLSRFVFFKMTVAWNPFYSILLQMF